nr:putative transcription antitermination factor NusB [uncultured bacterium]
MYELKEKRETPYRVIINEAILLAKQFGAVDSHKFINSVLDGVRVSIGRND